MKQDHKNQCSQISISILMRLDTFKEIIIIIITAAKSEKLSDSFIFNKN